MRGVGGFGVVAAFLAPLASESPGVSFGSEQMGKVPRRNLRCGRRSKVQELQGRTRRTEKLPKTQK